MTRVDNDRGYTGNLLLIAANVSTYANGLQSWNKAVVTEEVDECGQ